MTGVIKSIPSKNGQQANYAFIKAEDGKEYFLHASDLSGCTWADLKATIATKREATVEFDITPGLKGPRAANAVLV